MAIEDFSRRLSLRLAHAAVDFARPKVKTASTTLASALRVRFKIGREGRASAYIPHYWAVYVHEGRRPFSKEHFMVWFRDPKADPRLRGGKTPARVKDLRRLTKGQFQEALDLRRRWIAQGGDPYDSPVIITKTIRKGTPAKRFFGNEAGEGMFGFVERANKIGLDEFNKLVRAEMGDLFDLKLEINGRL